MGSEMCIRDSVWFPRGPRGNAESLDFAVTSGMRSGMFRLVAENPAEVFERYETFKQNRLQTQAQCNRAGCRFTPMVLEAQGGGWSGAFRGHMEWLARGGAATNRARPAAEALRMAQRINASLQKENARAVLPRLSSPEEPTMPSGWAHAGGEGHHA